MNFSEIEKKIEANKVLDFGTIFNKSIELFKKSWMHGLSLQLVAFVIIIPFILIFYIPFVMAIVANSENGQMNPDDMSVLLGGFSILYMGVFIIGILLLSVVTVAMRAAFFKDLASIDRGETVSFKSLFYFFKTPYLTNISLLMLASMAISIVAMLLCYLPLFYVMVPMSFFIVIFAFNPELTVSEIIKLSFKLGHKKWLITFGLVMVSSLLASMVGMLLCGIGIIVTAAFADHPLYFIYKEVIGEDTADSVEKIGIE
ncbi:hypothetical protein [Lacinutrix sp. Bg11-31]|uniref:hypothetical protein n=1 Tax=Lacinutrix sp. Bg11-31 TaxID=2057808 RepID=UPI000C31418D|nr:hypothetical protein [Lacinutrix sp. Bg11-31]AUC83550.1 hypothetical protein CW733_16015 [Lacinutrix sp. Bg11-31]